jgi:hypothetical protein
VNLSSPTLPSAAGSAGDFNVMVACDSICIISVPAFFGGGFPKLEKDI